MTQRNENWIHLFQILNIAKHKNGFTIYEITSMVYPKSCPDAITKLIVWKRFNDFKSLYNEIKKRAKTLFINEQIPKLPKSSYFKRFNENVIDERRQAALLLLEFIAKYPLLFTSDIFVRFFETSYVPQHQIKGNIDEIRDDLHLPEPPDIISINSLSSDDDKCTTYTEETDSISTNSNLSLISSQLIDSSYSSECSFVSPSSNNNIQDQINSKKMDDLMIATPKCLLKSVYSETNLPSIPEISGYDIFTENKLSNSLSWNDSLLIRDRVEVHYMTEAAKHISNAQQYENNKNYEQAFISYKLGISSLLNGVKNDSNVDRKESVRHKVAKYLLKAEKIYNIHLNLNLDEQNWNGDIAKKLVDSLKVERPLNELINIKVIDLISTVMLVAFNEQPDLYVLKIIRKNGDDSSSNISDAPILPIPIPFMVKLYKYFCTEHSFYVLLEYASGGLLWNYFKKYKHVETKLSTEEDSYLKLIQEYKFGKDESTEPDTNQLLQNSQELLESVSDLLERNKISRRRNSSTDKDIDTEIDNKIVFNDFDQLECWSEECQKQWQQLPNSIVLKYAAQLVIALEALHRIGYIWCDLQPKNLLLSKNGDLRLTFIQYLYHWDNIDVNKCWNYPDSQYIAPELNLIGAPVTKAVDWWSFGVLLYEMLTGLKFYLCHPGGFTSTSVVNIPKFISPDAHSLLNELLVYTPEERLGYGLNGADKIKNHAFFKTVDWNTVVSK